MFKIGTSLLLALSACSLWKRSLGEHLQSGHVCLIDEPNPNQCESFCLNALQPLLIETKSKLDGLEGQQVKMEERLEAKLRHQHQAVQTKVDEVHAKLERDLLEVKTTLQDQQAILTKIETQMQAIIKNINNNQAAIEEIPERITKKIPKGFERIGERYFRIVEDQQNWHSAVKKCREMGGYLAAFRDQKEVDAVRAKLSKFRIFWTGINDLDTNGQFVSVTSNKTAEMFVPIVKYNVENSESLHGYICQSDNET